MFTCTHFLSVLRFSSVYILFISVLAFLNLITKIFRFNHFLVQFFPINWILIDRFFQSSGISFGSSSIGYIEVFTWRLFKLIEPPNWLLGCMQTWLMCVCWGITHVCWANGSNKIITLTPCVQKHTHPSPQRSTSAPSLSHFLCRLFLGQQESVKRF